MLHKPANNSIRLIREFGRRLINAVEKPSMLNRSVRCQQTPIYVDFPYTGAGILNFILNFILDLISDFILNFMLNFILDNLRFYLSIYFESISSVSTNAHPKLTFHIEVQEFYL